MDTNSYKLALAYGRHYTFLLARMSMRVSGLLSFINRLDHLLTCTWYLQDESL